MMKELLQFSPTKDLVLERATRKQERHFEYVPRLVREPMICVVNLDYNHISGAVDYRVQTTSSGSFTVWKREDASVRLLVD